MSFRLFCFVLACIGTTSCVSQPDVYAPPAQRKPLDQAQLIRKTPLFDMGDPAVEFHIVSDIATGPQQTSWRWANQKPTIKFELLSVTDLKYRMEFTIPDVTFKETGPVTITYFINDQQFDKARYDSPGQKVYEKPIHPSMLRTRSMNTIAAEIDKPYVAGDGVKLGFILSKFGLVQ